MAIGSVSPVGIQQFHDNNGDPLAGGKLLFFEAGTSTLTPAYADFNLTTPLSNPVILDAGGRAPQLFLAATSYKQVLQDALGVTLWTADNIVTPTALRSTTATSSITGTNHNVPVPAGIISFLTFSNTTPLTVTGFSGGTPGQILIIRAGQNAPVFLEHLNSGSLANNQLFNFVGSGPTALAGTKGIAVYVHAGWIWTLVTHEQGNWIPIPYSAGLFSVQGTGSWTVDAADQTLYSYYLKGTTCLVTFRLQTTTVAGGPSYLNIAGLPYKFVSDVTALPILITTPPTVMSPGTAFLNLGLALFSIVRPDQTVFPDMTNTFTTLGQFSGNVS
jgi:hypothetical protein